LEEEKRKGATSDRPKEEGRQGWGRTTVFKKGKGREKNFTYSKTRQRRIPAKRVAGTFTNRGRRVGVALAARRRIRGRGKRGRGTLFVHLDQAWEGTARGITPTPPPLKEESPGEKEGGAGRPEGGPIKRPRGLTINILCKNPN